MTPAEILDDCEHRQERHPSYDCCGRCDGPCRPCAERAIAAAVETERVACMGHIRATVDRVIAQLGIIVRLSQPDGAVKVAWSRTRRELIERAPAVEAVVIIRNALDDCTKAIRARGGR